MWELGIVGLSLESRQAFLNVMAGGGSLLSVPVIDFSRRAWHSSECNQPHCDLASEHRCHCSFCT